MHPDFLGYQLKQSLDRLGLETIDLLMLQNPYEQGLMHMTILEYKKMFMKVVEFYEKAVSDGKIKNWGITANPSLLWHPITIKKRAEKFNMSVEKL